MGAAAADLQRDVLHAEMRRHQYLLESAAPDYFRLLPVELSRPQGELMRCRCAPRYVAVRRTVQGNNSNSNNRGRQYYCCPLRPRGANRSNAPAHCSFWEWVV